MSRRSALPFPLWAQRGDDRLGPLGLQIPTIGMDTDAPGIHSPIPPAGAKGDGMPGYYGVYSPVAGMTQFPVVVG